MEPALQACNLLRAVRWHAVSPRRRCGPSAGLGLASSLAVLLLAAAAAALPAPALAECILQPDQTAPEGTHWTLRTDQTTNRRCWVLVDSAGRVAAPAPPAAAPPPPSSTLGSFFSNLIGGPAPAPAPVAVEPPPEPAPVRKPPPPRTAAAAPKSTAPAQPPKGTYTEMTPEQREALFAAFMRWKASRQTDDGGEAKEQQPPPR